MDNLLVHLVYHAPRRGFSREGAPADRFWGRDHFFACDVAPGLHLKTTDPKKANCPDCLENHRVGLSND